MGKGMEKWKKIMNKSNNIIKKPKNKKAVNLTNKKHQELAPDELYPEGIEDPNAPDKNDLTSYS